MVIVGQCPINLRNKCNSQIDNFSNYDIQWRHKLSIGLDAFVLHKIAVSVLTPIHFAQALHVHPKYYS